MRARGKSIIPGNLDNLCVGFCYVTQGYVRAHLSAIFNGLDG